MSNQRKLGKMEKRRKNIRFSDSGGRVGWAWLSKAEV